MLLDELTKDATAEELLSNDGELEIEVPRDRVGDFEPQLVRKRQVRLSGSIAPAEPRDR